MLSSASGNYASRLAATTSIHPVGRADAVKTTARVSPDDGDGRGEARLPVRDVREEEEEWGGEEEEEKEEEEEVEEKEEESEKHVNEDKDAQESDYYAMSASVRRTIKQVIWPGCNLFSRSTVSTSIVKHSPRTYPHLPLASQLAQSDVCYRPPPPPLFAGYEADRKRRIGKEAVACISSRRRYEVAFKNQHVALRPTGRLRTRLTPLLRTSGCAIPTTMPGASGWQAVEEGNAIIHHIIYSIY